MQRGQGLLEATIALGIIITGVVAALTLGIANLSAGVTSESRIVAANLAREGVEVVRNIRDTNWTRGNAWDADLAIGTYTLRWDPTMFRHTIIPFATASESGRLYRFVDSAIMTADANAGTATPFFRKIILEDICTSGALTCIGDDRTGIRVRSHVGWERKGVAPAKPQIEIVAELYKWR